jgi:predicted nucleotidyltransferase
MACMEEAEAQRLFAAARKALLAALPSARAIYVYGSHARGEAWPGSDLDLAVLLPPGDRIKEPLTVIDHIARSTGVGKVDLVELGAADDVIRGEVLAHGRLLYAARPQEVLAWEASALSRQAEHRERIRDILADFRKSGIGYAP